MQTTLTERQQRELDYHREHAKLHQSMLAAPFSWEVLDNPGQRWWNAYWAMFAHLQQCNVQGKAVLVVGCGFGDDALRLAKMGARVSAFDLSPDSLEIARALAARERLEIDFQPMPSERMSYADDSFDLILCRDILHHVDIQATMREIVRVARPGARFVVNEIYSHSITDRIRRSALVERWLYPRMRALIYGTSRPYITEDERKLTEADLALVMKPLDTPRFRRHFYMLVTRLVPERWRLAAQADQLLLRLLAPVGPVLAGRVLFSAAVRKGSGSRPE
jgi:2-polyprenyl-3-methyl-5-hydroxy-6-metoxy-1,4-benzoquinol methylase